MRYILLFFLSMVQALDIHQCKDALISDMNLKVCHGLRDYEKIDFNDHTGENVVRLKNNKIFRNHGEYVALYKDHSLYVAKEKYGLKEWEKLKNNLK